MATDDFVDLVGHLTNFVQNERVAAYNEAVTDMKKSVKDWIREQKLDPVGDDIPTLLDSFIEAWAKVDR